MTFWPLTVLLVATLTLMLWPWQEKAGSSDAVVVLGGGRAERAELGIALQKAHDAELVLFASARMFANRQGIDCDGSVICLAPEPWNTVGEARMTTALVQTRGWHRVTVVTNPFHAVRARTLFKQCLGHRVRVVSAERHEGGRPITWRTHLGEALGAIGAWIFRPACSALLRPRENAVRPMDQGQNSELRTVRV